MSLVYMACYPKVGSEYVKKSLNSVGPITVRAKEHNMNIKWSEERTCPVLTKDTKIIYLCANPMNAVLSLLHKHFYKRFTDYNPTLSYKKLSFDTLMSYENIFGTHSAKKHACWLTDSGDPRRPTLVWQKVDQSTGEWQGAQSLIPDPNYVRETLTHVEIENINKNFVSYMVNNDLLGYKEHFDIWTKTPLNYERCILRYEYLQDSETLRSLEEFLEVEPFSLQLIADNYRPRRTAFVAAAEPLEMSLERSYGELAAEINKLDGFTRLARGK